MSDERNGREPGDDPMETEGPFEETPALGELPRADPVGAPDVSEASGEPAAETPFSGILPEAPIEPPPVVTLPGAPAPREAGPPALPPRPRREESDRPRREESDRPRTPRGPRPELAFSTEPLYRDRGGYRMRLEPPDLARLRELPGSKGKTDQELGETFFDGYSERFVASLAEDVPAPAEVRVVVDPYSRQAFLAVEKKIRSILSF